jgi:hypothetical protein
LQIMPFKHWLKAIYRCLRSEDYNWFSLKDTGLARDSGSRPDHGLI